MLIVLYGIERVRERVRERERVWERVIKREWERESEAIDYKCYIKIIIRAEDVLDTIHENIKWYIIVK